MNKENMIESFHLKRTLTTKSLVVFGLAYLTPMVVLAIFGVIAETSGGSASGAYLIAMIAMLFTANSYGQMAKVYPGSGSAYTYVRKGISPSIGFLAGWTVLLDYLFLPLVIWLIGASYLNTAFPMIPSWVWILGFVVITTILNVVGIKVAEKTNIILMAFQMLVLLFFVFLSISWLLRHEMGFNLSPFYHSGTSLTAITSAAAIAAYSFLGFDAVTTLSEETVRPERDVPRAVLLVALIGGSIFIVVSYFAQLVHPGGEFSNADSAATEIVSVIGGSLFGAVFLTGLILAQFASGIAAQASVARLLFVMGRDGVIPIKAFGRVHQKYHTPIFSIIISAAVGLGAIFMDVATSTSFINFGAFLAFTSVNGATICHYFRSKRVGHNKNVVLFLIFPFIGALISLFLLSQLDLRALLIGVVWLFIGLFLLGYVTRGFRVTPPEMAD